MKTGAGAIGRLFNVYDGSFVLISETTGVQVIFLQVPVGDSPKITSSQSVMSLVWGPGTFLCGVELHGKSFLLRPPPSHMIRGHVKIEKLAIWLTFWREGRQVYWLTFLNCLF